MGSVADGQVHEDGTYLIQGIIGGMSSKLTVHLLNNSSGAPVVVAAGVKVAKLVSNFGPGKEEYPRLSPGVLIIGREYTETTAQNLHEKGLSPRAAAEAFMAEQLPQYKLNPWITYWEGTNEPVMLKDHFPWLGEFEKQRIIMMGELGLRSVAFNFSTGYPHIAQDDLSWWTPLVPALRELRNRNGILGLHAYSDHKLTEDPSNILRYRDIHDLVLVPNGLGDLRIVLTEFGRTYWKITPGLTEEQYLSELTSIDSELMKDDYMLGATIYTFGNTRGWEDFDVNDTIIPQGVANHIRAVANQTPTQVKSSVGIDVSHHQGVIDWEQVKNSGVEFAFIRTHFGATTPDAQFTRNWAEAKKHGIIRGAYQYFRPTQDAVRQAEVFLVRYKPESGDLPPALDVEVEDGVPVSGIVAGIKNWLEVVQRVTKVRPLIYTSDGFWDKLGNPQVEADLWVASWTDRSTPSLPNNWKTYKFWQYKVGAAGEVPGITTRIDRNRFNGTLEQLKAYASVVIAPPMDVPIPLFKIEDKVTIGARGTPPSTGLNVRKDPVGGVIGEPIVGLKVGTKGVVKSMPFYAKLNGNKVAWVRVLFEDGTEGYVSQSFLNSEVVIPVPAPGKLPVIRNANLDDGFYRWNGIREIVIPNEWNFWYQTDKTLRINRQDSPFDPPETVVWYKKDAPSWEQDLFFLSGDYCLKVFKGWGVIWWRLFQTVSGLEAGERYRFTAPIYPDLVMDYKDGQKVFADDPLAGEVRLTAGASDTGYLVGLEYGKYTRFTVDFTASGPTEEVSLECRGRWGLINNGWFVDSLDLEKL